MEKDLKTVVVSFGRMSPPTIGHAKLLDAIIRISKKENGDAMVYVSHTEDKKKNPLSYETKVDFLAKVTKGIVKKDPQKKVKNIFDLLKFLDGKYDRVIVVAGSDRVSEYDANLNRYNGKDYQYDKIEVVSAGERDPDADGEAGISASKMRQFAMDDDFKSFKKGFFPGANELVIKDFFDEIREKLQKK